ncbi:Hypothetical protein PBC10988_36990 [Planctomycetales bacterium 10988]|nr:Hypothetical protein PBC10988_36990 [Planctomycetales bacterium 10988]
MSKMQLLKTGIPQLDGILGGGLPLFSVNLIAGPPGVGKTIMALQMLFHPSRMKDDYRSLYLSTASEPLPKVLRYAQHFSFFDPDAFGQKVIFSNLVSSLREERFDRMLSFIHTQIDKYQPKFVVIDSLKAIRDLTKDLAAFRLFCFDLASLLATKRCTALLIGEYPREEMTAHGEAAIVDAIFSLSFDEEEGEHRRYFQVIKSRGIAAPMKRYPILLNKDGVEILDFSQLVDCLQSDYGSHSIETSQAPTGIPGLDPMLEGGIPRGNTVLLRGPSGSGKTLLSWQFLLAGLRAGEPGLFVGYGNSEKQIIQQAQRMGWDIESFVSEGLLQIHTCRLSELRVDEELFTLYQKTFQHQPRRIVVDSLSSLCYRVEEQRLRRERLDQLAELISSMGAVGFLLLEQENNGLARAAGKDPFEPAVADGLIDLSFAKDNPQITRLQVVKMRGCKPQREPTQLRWNEQGAELISPSS